MIPFVVEIPAKTKVALLDDRGFAFPIGTDVLLLEQLGDEWFVEIVTLDDTTRCGKRYSHFMVKHDNLDIEQ